MSRKGALSAKTYFPGRGDQLMDEDAGVCWEVVRVNRYKDDAGVARYGLMKGWSGDEVSWRPFSDKGTTHLQSIMRIIRADKKEYVWNELTQTWQEEG
jgi:hypothetical protein